MPFMHKQALTAQALDIPTVKAAHFTIRPHHISGVVYDGSVGIEFDVRLDSPLSPWIVSDDDGRLFKAYSLKRALRKAIEANA